MHGELSAQIQVVTDSLVIDEKELTERAIAVVARIVDGDPFLIDCVSSEIKGSVNDILKSNCATAGISDYPRPQSPIDQTKELPAFLTSAASRICHDLSLGGHLERVGMVAFNVASAMGLGEDKSHLVRLGGRLHDIGKLDTEMHHLVGLNGVLPPEQKARIKLHPLIGARVAEYFRFPKDVTKLILNHHFRCDGMGYPAQNGEAMSLEIGALSVADAIDAMVNARPGREVKTLEQAVKEIENGSGKHFHPEAVEALSRVAIRFVYG